MSPVREGLAQPANVPVLVVIPCLNEQEYIANVVAKLIAEAVNIGMQIVVADGGSTDQTRHVVQRLQRLYPRLTLMDNSNRIQASALNETVRRYGHGLQTLIRIDAHASYPDRYCETLLNVQARTQADSVVVSMRAAGSTCFQRAAAAAQNSILGNGGSAHRNKAADRWVDHGHHALMRLDAFNAVGGYDETFSHNEDAELDARLIKHGFHIFHTGEVHVTYYPRETFAALFRQYFSIGRGRARTLLKHRKHAKLRHLVLVAVVPAICLAVLLPLSGFFAVPALAWVLLCVGYGVVLGVQLRDPCATLSGIAAIAMQAGWSFGFFRGLIAELCQRGVKIATHATTKQSRII